MKGVQKAMRTMLLSFKADVYKRVLSGEKIYEHRRVFPDEPIKAYLYVSTPIKSIVGIMHLGRKVSIESWKSKYAYDIEAVKRIDEYLAHHNFAMEILQFQNTNKISLERLKTDITGFVVPQMYYYIDDTPLLNYLEKSLINEGPIIEHKFDNITSDMICTH